MFLVKHFDVNQFRNAIIILNDLYWLKQNKNFMRFPFRSVDMQIVRVMCVQGMKKTSVC